MQREFDLSGSPRAEFCLHLAVRILRTVEDSGATQADAFTALQVANSLVGRLNANVRDSEFSDFLHDRL